MALPKGAQFNLATGRWHLPDEQTEEVLAPNVPTRPIRNSEMRLPREVTGGTMGNNRIDVRPGDPCFNILSNLCDYFELGKAEGADVWLEGQVIEGEHIFNGRLFAADGSSRTIIDNFPNGSVPDGWQQRRRMDVDGYELLDARGETVFSFHVDDQKICHVDVNLYKADRSVAAHSGQGALVTHVPTRLGRNGILIDQ